MRHWTILLRTRRAIARALRSRVILHHKAGEAAPRLVKAYERWKALVAQAERGLARARRTQRVFMYDDTNLALIPSDAEYVASYVDGRFANAFPARAQFPKAKHITITVLGGTADAGDIETGDMTPTTGALWALRMIRAGRKPRCYANRSTMPAVIAALIRLGIKRNQVLLWTADYTGKPHLPVFRWGNKLTTSDACQFTDKALGRSLDESVCLLRFFDAA